LPSLGREFEVGRLPVRSKIGSSFSTAGAGTGAGGLTRNRGDGADGKGFEDSPRDIAGGGIDGSGFGRTAETRAMLGGGGGAANKVVGMEPTIKTGGGGSAAALIAGDARPALLVPENVPSSGGGRKPVRVGLLSARNEFFLIRLAPLARAKDDAAGF
jgi:hypothetical protein